MLLAIRRAFLSQRRAHAYSVARMASPTGITTKAGPGKTSRAMPINRIVAPTTETITRLTTLVFSTCKPLKRCFIQCRRVRGRFIARVQCPLTSSVVVKSDWPSINRGTQTIEKWNLCRLYFLARDRFGEKFGAINFWKLFAFAGARWPFHLEQI